MENFQLRNNICEIGGKWSVKDFRNFQPPNSRTYKFVLSQCSTTVACGPTRTLLLSIPPCPPAPLRRDHSSLVGNPTSHGCRRIHRDGAEVDGCDFCTQTGHWSHSCEIGLLISPDLTLFLFFVQGLEVCGSPVMTAFSVRSCDSQVSIFAVADVMEKNGTSHSTTQPSFCHQRKCPK